MAYEIERKFLVSNDAWRISVTHVEQFRDGLIARFGGGKVRVRQAQGRAWIAVKGPRTGISRAEFEYEIPVEDAEEMLSTLCDGPIIEKDRHCVPYSGRLWSIDVHKGALEGLTFAEVEIATVDEVLDIPAWIGVEITEDPQYRKQALLQRCLDADRA